MKDRMITSHHTQETKGVDLLYSLFSIKGEFKSNIVLTNTIYVGQAIEALGKVYDDFRESTSRYEPFSPSLLRDIDRLEKLGLVGGVSSFESPHFIGREGKRMGYILDREGLDILNREKLEKVLEMDESSLSMITKFIRARGVLGDSYTEKVMNSIALMFGVRTDDFRNVINQQYDQLVN